MTVRVISEKQWSKVEADYVLRHEGEFDSPNGRVRRCGHRHFTAEAARRCAGALEHRVWLDAR